MGRIVLMVILIGYKIYKGSNSKENRIVAQLSNGVSMRKEKIWKINFNKIISVIINIIFNPNSMVIKIAKFTTNQHLQVINFQICSPISNNLISHLTNNLIFKHIFNQISSCHHNSTNPNISNNIHLNTKIVNYRSFNSKKEGLKMNIAILNNFHN